MLSCHNLIWKRSISTPVNLFKLSYANTTYSEHARKSYLEQRKRNLNGMKKSHLDYYRLKLNNENEISELIDLIARRLNLEGKEAEAEKEEWLIELNKYGKVSSKIDFFIQLRRIKVSWFNIHIRDEVKRELEIALDSIDFVQQHDKNEAPSPLFMIESEDSPWLVWHELLDPNTDKVYYANPLTGQCSWSRPPGKILDTAPDFYELYDEQWKRVYYLDSKEQEVHWELPTHCNCIPAPFSSSDDEMTSNRLKVGYKPLTKEEIELLNFEVEEVELYIFKVDPKLDEHRKSSILREDDGFDTVTRNKLKKKNIDIIQLDSDSFESNSLDSNSDMDDSSPVTIPIIQNNNKIPSKPLPIPQNQLQIQIEQQNRPRQDSANFNSQLIPRGSTLSMGSARQNRTASNSSPKSSSPTDQNQKQKKNLTLVQETVQASNWFQYLTGYKELEWRKLTNLPIKKLTDGSIVIGQALTGKTYSAGILKSALLKDLIKIAGEEKIQKVLSKTGRRYPVFEVIMPKDPQSVKFCSMNYLQAQPENKNAVFQLITSFNTLHHVSETHTLQQSDFIEQYYNHNTNSANASISAGAAAIARRYTVYYDPSQPEEEWKQTPGKQINFLENLSSHFPVTNGYVKWNGKESKFKTKKWRNYIDSYRAYWQANVQVVFGERNNNDIYVEQTGQQYVDHVFAGAIGLQNERSSQTIDIDELKAQFVLDCGFHTSYLCAVINQRSKLYLSPVGFDVGNLKEWIYNSIYLAHRRWAAHPKSHLEKIVLVLNDANQWHGPFLTVLKRNRMAYRVTSYVDGTPQVIDVWNPPPN